MKTGGYDLVLELTEKAINKFLNIGFYVGKFPEFKGTYALPIPDVPAGFEAYTTVGYNVCLLTPPALKIEPSNSNMLLSMPCNVKLTLLGGIDIDLGVELKLNLSPAFSTSNGRLFADLSVAQISDVILTTGVTRVTDEAKARLMVILTYVMNKYLKEELGTLELGPDMLSSELPYMRPGDENKLTLNVGTLKVLTTPVLGLAANVLGGNGGAPDAIADFSGDSHFAFGLTEDAIRRVYNFWWSKSTCPKGIQKSDHHDFDISLPGWIDTLKDWAVRIGTGGLFSQDIDLNYVRMAYDLKITFSKFGIDIKPGNRVRLSGSILIDLRATVNARVTTTTEVLTIDVDKTSYWVPLFDSLPILLPIDIGSATAEISTDNENKLIAKIVDLDLDTPLVVKLPGFPDLLYNWLKDWVFDQIMIYLPPIPLYSSVIKKEIPDTNLTIEAKISNITTTDTEALVGLKTRTIGVGDNAPFVCNKSKEHMEIHKKDCVWVKKILAEHRAYYIDLDEALDDGFDGCKFCLPEYHTR